MNREEYDVLFVDDDENILKALRRNLHDKYKVSFSSTVEGALELLETNNYSVIFSDMQMPVMNGADFLILVKEKSPDSIRVLLTGETDLNDAIKAVNESDIYKILLKPCSHENICSTIDTALKLYNAHKLEEVLMDKSLKGFVYIILDLLGTISPEIFQRSTDITKIVRSPRTNFTLKNPWAFEVSCLLMYLGSIHLKIYKFVNIYNSDNLQKVILQSANLLSKVPKFEAVHSILVELAELYSKEGPVKDLHSDAKTLKLIVDYHSLINDSQFQAKIRSMYSKEVILQLPHLFGKKAQQKKVTTIKANQLKVGMTTAEDIKTQSGSVIVSKGELVTDLHISTVEIFSEKGFLVNSIKVVEV